jgi:Uma2 family endonuclease
MNQLLLETPLPSEYLRTLERGPRYEWINDQLREKPPMGAKANRVATILAAELHAFATEKGLGLVFTQDCGYRIFPGDPRKVRKPDVSFIPFGRLPDDYPPEGHATVPPDLEVEVVSPNDEAEEIDHRVADYLSAGVKLIWIVYPATRSVWLVRRDGSAARLTEAHELSGEDVLPGFTFSIQKLFELVGRPKGQAEPHP